MLRAHAQVAGTAEGREVDEDREQGGRRADVLLPLPGKDLPLHRQDDLLLQVPAFKKTCLSLSLLLK